MERHHQPAGGLFLKLLTFEHLSRHRGSESVNLGAIFLNEVIGKLLFMMSVAIPAQMLLPVRPGSLTF